MKTAIVTGASRGIGYAVARDLVAENWCVLGLSRTAPPPTPGLYWFAYDAGTAPSAVPDILGMAGIETLDALIHCAGSQEPVGDVADTDPAAWTRALDANLGGAYRTVHAALPFLLRSADARILLFSGGGAFSPRPHFSAYACAKAGVVALTEALADELPPHVAVTCVAPGFVPTDIHAPTIAAGPGVVGDEEYRFALRSGADALEIVRGCVRHLLGPETRGLSGRTVSAPWDDWASLSPLTVPLVMASPAGLRTRHKIAALGAASLHPNAILPCPVGSTA